jgi:hypothetical protein
MKAISVRQPWAWLIMHGGKDIENRSWSTKMRGRVWIHAAKKMDRGIYSQLAMLTLDLGIRLPPESTLDLGGIIGSVEIIGCVESSPSVWFFGPHGLVLRNPKPIVFHPCRGMLHFFDVPPWEIKFPGQAR